MKRTLVLGLGNILLADEGMGVRVVERLEEGYAVPAGVEVLDGGTLGLDLLGYVADADRMVVVDALEMDRAAGTIGRLEGEQIPAFLGLKISPHQMGLADLLVAARLSGTYPEEVVPWGAQPGRIEAGLELSPAVADQVETLVEKVVAELRRWGVAVEERKGRS